MSGTATEVRLRVEMFERRLVRWRVRLNEALGELLAKPIAMASRRRRKSKGWRRHVRKMKAARQNDRPSQ